MKIACFHLLPYLDLADDFEKKTLRLKANSFGGMLAAELAAQGRKSIGKLMLTAPVYAEEFGKAWPHSAVCMLPRCGHEPPLEQVEMPRDKVTGLLAAAAI